MKEPGFWWSSDRGWQSHALSPLAALWTWQTARRVARPPEVTEGIPVICVGNLTIGGTGKTPTVIALLDMLTARGKRAFVLSRGYGGTEAGPVLVDLARHTAHDVGDEPVLLSAFAPVVVSRDRGEGARLCTAEGADVIVMDDGFQNPKLAKTLSILVVDAARGFGNRAVIPSGPLREPVSAGLARADMMLLIGSTAHRTAFLNDPQNAFPKPVLQGALTPLQTGISFKDRKVVAFAGIGNPQKFFDTLRAEGAHLVGTHGFADHAPFSDTILQRLTTEATSKHAQLVTTEKDAARLPASWLSHIRVLPVRLHIDDPEPLGTALDRMFG